MAEEKKELDFESFMTGLGLLTLPDGVTAIRVALISSIDLGEEEDWQITMQNGDTFDLTPDQMLELAEHFDAFKIEVFKDDILAQSRAAQEVGRELNGEKSSLALPGPGRWKAS